MSASPTPEQPELGAEHGAERAESGPDVAETVAATDQAATLETPTTELQAQPSSARGVGHHVGQIRHRARQHPVTRVVWQVLVAAVGAACLVAGGAMLVLPGPGWAVIALGLLILASEFVWFERPLRPVRRFLERANSHVSTPARRRLLVVLVVIAVVVSAVTMWLALTGRWHIPKIGR